MHSATSTNFAVNSKLQSKVRGLSLIQTSSTILGGKQQQLKDKVSVAHAGNTIQNFSLSTNKISKALKEGHKKIAASEISRGKRAVRHAEQKTTSPNNASNNSIRVHFVRKDTNYKGWDLHAWGPGAASPTQWWDPNPPSGVTMMRDGPGGYGGIYWDVPLSAVALNGSGSGSSSPLGLLVHKGDLKAAGTSVPSPFSES